MKNYLVKATRSFNDMEEKTEYGTDTPRVANESIWYCTKERYEYLKQNNAVTLVGIDKVEEPIKEKRTKKKKIVEKVN